MHRYSVRILGAHPDSSIIPPGNQQVFSLSQIPPFSFPALLVPTMPTWSMPLSQRGVPPPVCGLTFPFLQPTLHTSAWGLHGESYRVAALGTQNLPGAAMCHCDQVQNLSQQDRNADVRTPGTQSSEQSPAYISGIRHLTCQRRDSQALPQWEALGLVPRAGSREYDGSFLRHRVSSRGGGSPSPAASVTPVVIGPALQANLGSDPSGLPDPPGGRRGGSWL